MPQSECECCGGTYLWVWEEAFDKFGFNDGDGQVETETVANVLREAGYRVETVVWGIHNRIILSIKRDDVEQMPDRTLVAIGYDNPRGYLPKAIIELLDARLPAPD